MVFQNVVRTGVKARSAAVARYRVLAGARLWCIAGLSLLVTYLGTYGYVYNLSRVRHRLVIERNQQRQEFFIRQSRVESLRSPLRIEREAQRLGMVPLTRPEAVGNTPVVLAKRD